MRRALLILSGILLAGVAGGFQAVVAQVPPDESWRSLETDHFRVTFPEGMDALARRAGARAERAFDELSEAFIDPPEGLIELLLTDHTDTSNGLATAVPFNQINVYAYPPMEGPNLSYFDDWMELVITHELVHVFQLDHTGPIGSLIRSVFGRWEPGWPTFPEYDVPLWTTEGLATYYESFLTTSGRVRGSYVDMVLRTAVLEKRLERLDQVTGNSPNWPAGSRVYVYGSSFFDYLSETYGEERMGAFVDAIARQWVPYRVNSAAMDAFGVDFSDSWEDWRSHLNERFEALADSLSNRAPITVGEPIAVEGWQALFPSISPDGSRLAFMRWDGRSDAQIRVAEPDGSNDRKLARVSSLSDFAWLPDGSLVAPDIEYIDAFRLRSDLIHIDPEGRKRRLTHGVRLDHPTPSPDGASVVAVQSMGGTNRLVRVDLETGDVLALTPYVEDQYWSYPVLSPDGRWIAASRWSPGAYYDVVVMDSEGRIVDRVSNDRAVDQAPSWSPDGRWLLWSSDRSGIPNLYATEIDRASGASGPVRQVTNVLGGTAYPSVSPDGRWIYFSSYHEIGWTIERIPFDPAGWFDPFPMKPGFAPGNGLEADPLVGPIDGEVRPYRAFATLRPYYWEPTLTSSRDRFSAAGSVRKEVMGPAFGVRTSGGDLVGRHAYGVAARVRTSGQTEGAVAYAYAGLGNPILGLSASQRHDVDGPFLVSTPNGTPTLYVAERERLFGGSSTLVRRGVRGSASLSLSASHIWQDREFLDADLDPSPVSIFRPQRRLGEAQVGGTVSTARAFPYSATAAAGVLVAVQARARRELALPENLRGSSGFDRSWKEATGVVQAYQSIPGPGHSDHVLAARVALGVAQGPGADAFHYSVGGAQGRSEAATGLELFGGLPLLFPVRGYSESVRIGRYAWSASGEYRFPLVNMHRGVGLWPIHMDRLSGAVFFDAGNAWGDAGPVAGRAPNSKRNTLASVGAELQASVTALFSTPMFFRLGAVHRLESGSGGPIYLRLGTAF